MRCLILVAAVLLLAACTTGKELPMVADSDPTWTLVPDHIDPAQVPR
jgi:outer membrane biogenesis lipoprotein LolB